MRKFILLIFIAATSVSIAQTVFEDNFDKESASWYKPAGIVNKTTYMNGFYQWRRNGDKSDQIIQYINRLDDRHDFTISAHILVKRPGTEYGIIWGGSEKANSKFFLIKGNKYRFLEAENGRITKSTEYRRHLQIKMDNVLKIVKKGNTIRYMVNDFVLSEEPYVRMKGKVMGVTQWNIGALWIDYFKVEGVQLPIEGVKDLYYPNPPENLGGSINSSADELTPIISPDGQRLYYSRRGHTSNIGGATDPEDVYVADLENGTWSMSRNLGGPINNGGPNAVHSVTPDGQTLLTINTYDSYGRQKGAGFSFSSLKSDGSWSIPEDAKIQGYLNLSPYNEFFLANSGNVLILSIQDDRSYGSRDLYVSFADEQGRWSKPRNMGMVINTPGKEITPFLASDGVTLYFSSNGHPGYGNNDVFMTRRLDDSWANWSKPLNIGEPVNGPGLDSYYSVPADGNYAYFVSSGEGFDTDIFQIKVPEKVKPKPVVIIKGTVRNSNTNEPLGARITYRDYITDKEVGTAHSDPTTGHYEIVLPLEKAYALFAQKEGFYSVSDQLDLKGAKNFQIIEKDLYLSPIEVGVTTQLHNVLFVRSKAVLLPGSQAELNRLLKQLQENPTMIIQVSGHTDNVGNPDLNKQLSEDRANKVRQYLIDKGIDASRIEAVGYGGEKPIADNSREDTRKLNRRVEFLITSY